MELRQRHKLDVLLAVAGIPRATYYYHLKKLSAPDKYAEIKEQIQTVYMENKKRVGYRRITLELRNNGMTINHKTVQRLMRQMGLFCRVRMRKYKSYRGELGTIAPNLLERDFEASRPNQKWVTDITEFALFGQKIYLSPILDLCSRDIVSYTISRHPYFGQVMDMLEKAFLKLPDGSELILHSDQGWQYQMKLYQRILKARGIR